MAGPGITIYFGCMVVWSDWPTFSFASGDVFDNTLILNIWNRNLNSDPWLSQVNHIFSRLGITSNFEDYGEAEISSGLSSSLTRENSCPVRDLFSASNFSNLGQHSPGLPIPLPRKLLPNGTIIIQIA
jgi:hypothetical protein